MMKKETFSLGEFAKDDFFYRMKKIYPPIGMKIKDASQKKRVSDRLRRVEWQIRWVIQMIEDEANVQNIVQQLSAVKSAMTQAVNEEIFCAIEKISAKKTPPTETELEEIRVLMKSSK
jgi:DNA-binding FrmR family transcriptional regulator